MENVWAYLRANKLAISVFDNYRRSSTGVAKRNFFANDKTAITFTTRQWAKTVLRLGPLVLNRKRRQVLRRGPRIVPLQTHPDAFLNCSPLRASGSFCSGSCEPSPPLKFPRILSWLAPALEILPVRNYSEEPLRSSCLPKTIAIRSGSEELFRSAPASWGLCAPL